MTIRVGINGFGRIGRLVVRGLAHRRSLGDDIELVQINDPRADARGLRRSLREAASLSVARSALLRSRPLHRSALWPSASFACYSPVLGGERRIGF